MVLVGMETNQQRKGGSKKGRIVREKEELRNELSQKKVIGWLEEEVRQNKWMREGDPRKKKQKERKKTKKNTITILKKKKKRKKKRKRKMNFEKKLSKKYRKKRKKNLE